MTDSVQDLITRLGNPGLRPAAVKELRLLGPGAVDGLVAALSGEVPAIIQKEILRILLPAGDIRAAEAFRRAVASPDEDVRSLGAVGLNHLGAPDAVAACCATIDDSPDPLHADMTPSIQALADRGMPVLPHIIPLLEAQDPRTRQHAQKVLELVSFQEVLNATTPPVRTEKARAEWARLWASNESYRWDGTEDQRRSALACWRSWLEKKSCL